MKPKQKFLAYLPDNLRSRLNIPGRVSLLQELLGRGQRRPPCRLHPAVQVHHLPATPTKSRRVSTPKDEHISALCFRSRRYAGNSLPPLTYYYNVACSFCIELLEVR